MDENKTVNDGMLNVEELIKKLVKLAESSVVERIKKLEDLTQVAVISTQEFDKKLTDLIEEKVEAIVEDKVDEKIKEVDVEDMVDDAIRDANIENLVSDSVSDSNLPDEDRVEEMISDTLKEGDYTDEDKVNKLIKAYIDDWYGDKDIGTCERLVAENKVLIKRVEMIERSLAGVADIVRGLRVLLFDIPRADTDKPEVK